MASRPNAATSRANLFPGVLFAALRPSNRARTASVGCQFPTEVSLGGHNSTRGEEYAASRRLVAVESRRSAAKSRSPTAKREFFAAMCPLTSRCRRSSRRLISITLQSEHPMQRMVHSLLHWECPTRRWVHLLLQRVLSLSQRVFFMPRGTSSMPQGEGFCLGPGLNDGCRGSLTHGDSRISRAWARFARSSAGAGKGGSSNSSTKRR
jgi:hypothetical protein